MEREKKNAKINFQFHIKLNMERRRHTTAERWNVERAETKKTKTQSTIYVATFIRL